MAVASAWAISRDLRTFDRLRQFHRVAHIERQNPFAVLVENRSLRVLENDVRQRVAGFAFLLDLGIELVGGVFGLPVAADEVHLVLEGAVRADRLAADLLFLLGDEGPAVFFACVGQQAVEGVASAHLEEDVLTAKLARSA